MAVFKCKMCGGNLTITEGETVCECEYCGSIQTVPNADDEKKMKMYERANKLRFGCDFDKAAGIYESITNEFSDEAEAFWGLVLCDFGIEYVDDPATGKKVPTCHRSSFESVMTNDNFEQVMECSDSVSRAVYREEAKAIEELRKGILEVSAQEEAYDIFICYKETDENGDRTIDSVIAQEVYDALKKEGYRVFFSRISLEDKLGMEYEPYIFAALNSAKIMLAFGTSYDNYHAVWVKNEWSRYLKLMARDKEKHLIPCYKNIDAYDIPQEFQHLQAQDMGKVGAIQDLVRGIKKIIPLDDPKPEVIISSSGTSIETLIKRGKIALEDQEWDKADGFFEEILNQDPENAEGYLGKWLAKIERRDLDGLVQYYESKYENAEGETIEACPSADDHINAVAAQYFIDGYLSEETIRNHYWYDRRYLSLTSSREKQKNEGLAEINSERLYIRTKQYAKEELAKSLSDAISQITAVFEKRIAEARNADAENVERIRSEYTEHINQADVIAAELYADASKRRELKYQRAVDLFNDAKEINDYETVMNDIQSLYSYKDTGEIIERCKVAISELKEKKKADEERAILEEKKAQEEWSVRYQREQEIYNKKYHNKRVVTVICIVVAVIFLIVSEGIQRKKLRETYADNIENILQTRFYNGNFDYYGISKVECRPSGEVGKTLSRYSVGLEIKCTGDKEKMDEYKQKICDDIEDIAREDRKVKLNMIRTVTVSAVYKGGISANARIYFNDDIIKY